MVNPFATEDSAAFKTLVAWSERAAKQGLLPGNLQPSIDDPDMMQRVVRYMQSGAPDISALYGPVIDVRFMNKSFHLGYTEEQLVAFGAPPAPFRGITFWHPGWSLCGQRDNVVVRERDLLLVQDWYEKYPWSTEEFLPGYRQVCLPAPATFSQNFAEEEATVKPFGEKAAHIAVATMGAMAYELATDQRLLTDCWARCENQTSDGCHAELLRCSVGLGVDDDWGGNRGPGLSLASARDSRQA